MSIYNSGNNDSNKAINLYNDLKKNTQDLVISEEVIKTVGTDKDFATIDEAFNWLDKIIMSGGKITLILDDGIHIMDSERLEYSDPIIIFLFNKSIEIKSESGIKENCTLAVKYNESIETGSITIGIFLVQNSKLKLSDLTLDYTIDGLSPGLQVLNAAALQSDVAFDNVVVKNGMGIFLSNNAYSHLNDCLIDSCMFGLATESGKGIVKNSTIQNCLVAGVSAHSGGNIILDNVTFSGNTQDTEIPLNEIQYDMSVVSDKTGPLSFKA